MTAMFLTLLLRLILWTGPTPAHATTDPIQSLRETRDRLESLGRVRGTFPTQPISWYLKRSNNSKCGIWKEEEIAGETLAKLMFAQFPALLLPRNLYSGGEGASGGSLRASTHFHIRLLPPNSSALLLSVYNREKSTQFFVSGPGETGPGGEVSSGLLEDVTYRYRKFAAHFDESLQPYIGIDNCTADFVSLVYNYSAQGKLLILYIPVWSVKVDLCNTGANHPLSGRHKCLNSTQCVHSPSSLPLDPDAYRCCCPLSPFSCLNASQLEEGEEENSLCSDPLTLRKVLVSINAICCSLCFVLIFVVLAQRKVQEYNIRGWALMELLLFGAGLLYCVLILEFFPPMSWTCCLLVWFRALGFVTFYGPIILKIYRNLIEYRVRKAHHQYVKEKDLLKYLGVGLLTTGTGLVGWSMGVVQREDSAPLVLPSPYPICRLEWWFILWHFYESAVMLYGVRLCWKARNTTWIERLQFSIAVLLEFVITLSSNIARYLLWYDSSADTMLIISFVQVHLTVTIAILLILVPKFYYVSEQGRLPSAAGPGSNKAHPSLAKLRDNLVNGTIEFAEIPIADMNPEDIRAELKRVYTQLRMYKLKSVYSDNPHISKKKGPEKKREKQQSSRRRVSMNTPSQSQRMMDLKRVEEEGSSFIRSNAEEETAILGPPSPPNDFTIHSSPHNVYLSQGTAPPSKRYKLESDLSVRV